MCKIILYLLLLPWIEVIVVVSSYINPIVTNDNFNKNTDSIYSSNTPNNYRLDGNSINRNVRNTFNTIEKISKLGTESNQQNEFTRLFYSSVNSKMSDNFDTNQSINNSKFNLNWHTISIDVVCLLR